MTSNELDAMSTNINVNCVRQQDQLLPMFHAGKWSEGGEGGIEVDGRVVAPQTWRRTPAGSQVEDRVKQTQMKPFTKISFWDSFMLLVGAVKCQLRTHRHTHTLIHRHARSPACDHTVSRVHQSVLPSIRESIKERCVVSLHLLRSSG